MKGEGCPRDYDSRGEDSTLARLAWVCHAKQNNFVDALVSEHVNIPASSLRPHLAMSEVQETDAAMERRYV